MATKSLSARLVVVLVVCGGFTAAGAQTAWPQRDDQQTSPGVQPPTELLREYPFRQGRLGSRERSDAGESASTTQAPAGEPSSQSNSWGIIAPVLLGATLVVLLVGLGLRAARGPAGGSGQQEAPTSRPRPSQVRFPRRSAGRRPRNSYAVVNQKGGVGKTTVSLTLGAAAVRRGSRVLLVDLDPQASATCVLGADADDRPSMTDVMLESGCPLGEAVRPTSWGLDLARADRMLRSADATGNDAVLARQLSTVGDYDLMLIDCPPSLGTLTMNALVATSGALVVTEPTFLALHSMEELLDALRDVTSGQNPSLELSGVVLNRVETTAEHKRSVARLEGIFGSQVWEPHIPKRAILQDAMREGVPAQDLQSHSHYALEIAEIFDALALRLEATQVKS